MSKNILFYILGGVLLTLLVIYVIYLLNFMVGQMSVVSGTDLLKTPEIATFNLEKFNQLQLGQ